MRGSIRETSTNQHPTVGDNYPMTVHFTGPDAWQAPFFELHVEVGPHPQSVPKVLAGIEALWQHPSLDGPFGDSFVEPSEQQRLEAITAEPSQTYGVARLPDENSAACGAMAQIPNLAHTLGLSDEIQQRLDYGPEPMEPEPDSFVFYIPSLDQLYGGDWWELWDHEIARPIEQWLTDLASLVFERVPFPFAVIGPEGGYDERDVRAGRLSGSVVLRPDPNGRRLEAVRPR
jgi:hypothetical protein